MVWSECKRKDDKSISKTNASPVDVLKTWENVINQVPNIHWDNYTKHTDKIIDSAWKTEKILDKSVAIRQKGISRFFTKMSFFMPFDAVSYAY